MNNSVSRKNRADSSLPFRTRPPIQQDRIVAFIRDAIVQGRLPAGGRVSGRIELQKQFGVSYLTVQRAFDRLRDDGFVVARGRGGTFVSEHLPNLCRYAVVFPSERGPGWVNFWTVIAEVAGKLSGPPALDLPVYEGVGAWPDSPGFVKLLNDVQNRRVAGIFFASSPFCLVHTPLMRMANLPRVAVGFMGDRDLPAVIRLAPDFLRKAVDFLVGKGRRRLALISGMGDSAKRTGEFRSLLSRHGLVCRPPWVQGVAIDQRGWGGHVAALLLQGRPADRPDGLIIDDDNLTAAVCEGVLASGVPVPEGLEIVSHANFPTPSPTRLPIARLGYDIRRVLAAAMESIDAQREGRPFPRCITVPVAFEQDLIDGAAGPHPQYKR